MSKYDRTCLVLTSAIDYTLTAVGAGMSKTGSHAWVAFAAVDAAANAITFYDIISGELTPVVSAVGTALYTIIDAFDDRDYTNVYVLRHLTAAASVTTFIDRYSLTTPSATAAASSSTGFDSAAATANLNTVPNLRGGDVVCNGAFGIFGQVTTIATGTVPAVSTYYLFNPITLALIVAQTFSGRSNFYKFARCARPRTGKSKPSTKTYVVYGPTNDTGSTVTPTYVTPAYVSVDRVRTSGAQVTSIDTGVHVKSVPQYPLSCSVAQPRKSGYPALIAVGLRYVVGPTGSPTYLVTPTANLSLVTSTNDRAELRAYYLSAKKFKLVAGRRVAAQVDSVALNGNGSIIYATLTNTAIGTAGASTLASFVLTDQYKLMLAASYPVASVSQLAVALCQSGVLAAGSAADAAQNSLMRFRTCKQEKCQAC